MARGRGISQREYDAKVREDIYRFIVNPMLVLVGIYIVSVLLQSFLKVQYEYFGVIFTGIGGIPYLIYYYKKELNL
ncbi:MAG TPA: hypothetical protein VIO58_04165 [Candidatus Methanoperedens sp.]